MMMQLPQNDTIPQWVDCYTTLVKIAVYYNYFFYWHRSVIYKYNTDRLQS